jgi:hypothetical protein
MYLSPFSAVINNITGWVNYDNRNLFVSWSGGWETQDSGPVSGECLLIVSEHGGRHHTVRGHERERERLRERIGGVWTLAF